MAFSGYGLGEEQVQAEAERALSEAEALLAEKSVDDLTSKRFFIVMGSMVLLICVLLSTMMFFVALITQEPDIITDFARRLFELPYYVWCILPFTFIGAIGLTILIVVNIIRFKKHE